MKMALIFLTGRSQKNSKRTNIDQRSLTRNDLILGAEMLSVQEVPPLSPRGSCFPTRSTVLLSHRYKTSVNTCQLIKPTHALTHCYSNHLQQEFTTGDLHSRAVKIDSTRGHTHQKGDTAHPFFVSPVVLHRSHSAKPIYCHFCPQFIYK